MIAATSELPPRLWNPNVAANWSLVFSPAFGAYLHARNAESLGRAEEAKANRIWFYASLIFLVVCMIPSFPTPIARAGGLGILVGWYATLGTKQIKHVKETWGKNYERNPWGKPLLIGLCGLIALFAIALILNIIFVALGGKLS